MNVLLRAKSLCSEPETACVLLLECMQCLYSSVG